MSKKILIAYATKCSSTVGVAQAIGESIAKNGIDIHIKAINEIGDLSGYDAVVLGSAIRMGQWLPEANNFVKHHHVVLNRLPIAIFSVHILNLGEDLESYNNRLAYTEPIKKIITPKVDTFFAGKIEPSQLNFLERLLLKAVNPPIGDFRDWGGIQSWAGDLFAQL